MEYIFIIVVTLLSLKFWKTLIPLGVLFLGVMCDGIFVAILGSAFLWLIFHIKTHNTTD